MTVEELIEILEQMPGEAPVFVFCLKDMKDKPIEDVVQTEKGILLDYL